ncbi:MAG: hypothetical protein KIT57_06525 [Blastocatellales bacterium]|nr:hypothetical protein [Blastocatellales bacterium]
MKLHAVLILAALLLGMGGSDGVFVGDLKPNTVAAFDRYAGARESQIGGEIRDAGRFLWVDHLPEAARQKAYADMRAGGIVIDQGKRTDVPDGLVHHWTGAGFIPGATLQQTLALIQDYDNHARHYHPDVIASKLIARNANNFRINLRFRKTKVITVVLDTVHEVTYTQLDSSRVASSAHTTRISEVEDAGTPEEKLLPPGRDSGFLWKMNTYWRFAERDGGTYVQCETISLTRSVPFGLGWIVNRFVNSVPQEGLTFTLERTRARVLATKK